ncbi:uncharacterized protein LOC132309615 [Cornus florida]|uniref:uncharacterized protein LOC132309615 n=1 Tax=Cornus florida TaxID=4283 RepID=UPI00289B2FD3|nr:uncharacterized protein LOC132309615 [Cornus florida]
MSGDKRSRRGLKICCGVTVISLAIIVIVCVTLFLTVLKPKQPQVTAHPASLENIQVQVVPTPSLNVTLGLVVTIDNPNYGSFKYKNTTAYISYYGTTVAEVPIEHETIPARSKLNITTYANITADKMVSSPHFWDDVAAGRFNLTSMATMHGKVSMFKIFRTRATILSTCDISIIVLTQDVESKCKSKIKL